MNITKIAIVDDQPKVITYLEHVINHFDVFEVIAIAYNGLEAVYLADFQPDIMLIDLKLPIMTGIEATQLIKSKNPNIKVIIMSDEADGYDVIEALSSGASGFLLKEWDVKKITTTIRDALENKIIIPATAIESITTLFRQFHLKHTNVDLSILSQFDTLPVLLTEREKEIALLLLKNHTNAQIASELYLSIGTVKNYLTSLYKKLDVTARKEAIDTLKNALKEKTVN